MQIRTCVFKQDSARAKTEQDIELWRHEERLGRVGKAAPQTCSHYITTLIDLQVAEMARVYR